MNEPIFEVINLADGKRMKIFAHGGIEGFPDGDTVIVNRIEIHANLCVLEALKEAEQIERSFSEQVKTLDEACATLEVERDEARAALCIEIARLSKGRA